MKRVFRIQGEGKVKDVGLRGLANHREIDRLNAEVAAIQALIPLGLHAIQDLFKDEVTRLAGPRYARTGGQPGLVRWSARGARSTSWTRSSRCRSPGSGISPGTRRSRSRRTSSSGHLGGRTSASTGSSSWA